MEEAGVQDFVTAPQPPPQQQAFSPSKRRKPFIPLLALLLLLAVLGFAATRFFGSRTQEGKTELTPTPTEVIFTTEQPSPTAVLTPTPSPTNTPTPKPTINPIDKATGLDRSELSVEVQNGSGTAGAATKASDFLKSLGYRVLSIGNAPSYNFAATTIEVKAAKSTFLSLLKKDLSTNYTIGTTSASLSATASADALVIVGRE